MVVNSWRNGAMAVFIIPWGDAQNLQEGMIAVRRWFLLALRVGCQGQQADQSVRLHTA